MTVITAPTQEQCYQYGLPLLGLMMSVSCIVIIEPAPYDLIGIVLFLILYAVGLTIPGGVGMPFGFLAIFLVGNFIGACFADDPVATIKSLSVRLYMIAIWLMLVSFIYQNPERVLPVIWKGYLIAALLAIFLGVGAYYRLIPYPDFVAYGHTRVKGPFKDPNVYGPFLIPAAMYTVARIETANGIKLLTYLLLFFVIAFGIIMGFSRGAWGSMAAALAFFMGMRFVISISKPDKGAARTVWVSGVLVVVGSLGIAWLVTSTPLGDMFRTRAKIQNYDVQHRFAAHEHAKSLTLDRPLGIGPGQTPSHLGMEVHNVYLQIAMEAGWIGAVGFYCFFLFTVWKAFWFCFRPSPHQALATAMLGSLLGMLVQSYFIDSTHWRHLHLITAILWGIMLSEQSRASRLS